MLAYFPAFLALGCVAGFLAGLLGVGGGLIIVPVLVWAFEHARPDSGNILHLALGTSLASILFTSVSSIRGHHGRGAVDWHILRIITPGILAGTFVGAALAGHISSLGLKWFFVVFATVVGLQMFANIKPKAARQLPGRVGMFFSGGVIGMVSSFVGIGGGSLSVPFMSWCNVPIHRAVGTSAAIGFPIAVAGAAGYVVSGAGVTGLPEWSLGFVYLPALFGISVCSMLTAGFGARLAHAMPVARLKQAFAGLLLLMALKMLIGLI